MFTVYGESSVGKGLELGFGFRIGFGFGVMKKAVQGKSVEPRCDRSVKQRTKRSAYSKESTLSVLK